MRQGFSSMTVINSSFFKKLKQKNYIHYPGSLSWGSGGEYQ